jgi:hypothetical protein
MLGEERTQGQEARRLIVVQTGGLCRKPRQGAGETAGGRRVGGECGSASLRTSQLLGLPECEPVRS